VRFSRRAAAFVVLGSVVLAGCLGGGSPPPPPPPPPPTQLCGLSFNSPSAYQTDYFNLGQAGTGWITADGFVPPVLPDGRAQLPDGRVVWWMSDTMTGSVGSGNSVPNPVNMHNSTVEQGSGCLTPHLATIPYNANVWSWPGAAVVVGNTLEVFSNTVVPASGSPGFEWKVTGTSRTRFSLPGLQLIDGPTGLPSLSNQTTAGQAIPFGVRSFFNAADSKVYLYGHTGSLYSSQSWVARAPAGQETNVGSWEFFTDSPAPNDWSSNFADIKPMEFTKNGQPDGAPIAQLSVVPYGSRYLAGAFTWDTISNDIRAWVSPTPWGPWEQQPATTATFQARASQQIAYDAHIVNLPGAGWTVVYGVNDPVNQNQDFTLYRGQFAAPSGLPSP
jgi:hypothetical protein